MFQLTSEKDGKVYAGKIVSKERLKKPKYKAKVGFVVFFDV